MLMIVMPNWHMTHNGVETTSASTFGRNEDIISAPCARWSRWLKLIHSSRCNSGVRCQHSSWRWRACTSWKVPMESSRQDTHAHAHHSGSQLPVVSVFFWIYAFIHTYEFALFLVVRRLCYRPLVYFAGEAFNERMTMKIVKMKVNIVDIEYDRFKALKPSRVRCHFANVLVTHIVCKRLSNAYGLQTWRI